jgi:hypothetical protein
MMGVFAVQSRVSSWLMRRRKPVAISITSFEAADGVGKLYDGFMGSRYPV